MIDHKNAMISNQRYKIGVGQKEKKIGVGQITDLSFFPYICF